MDKVKQYLELARKHHFWVLCLVSVVAGLVAWYTATKKLKAQFTEYTSQIDGAFSSLKGVASDQPHQDWTEGINKETELVAQDVLAAWKALYQEQKDKVFIWPKELSQDFLDAANQLTDPNAVIPRKLREYYQGMVKEQVERLPAIVDAAGLHDVSGNPHRVDWSTSSLQEIEDSFDWSERPTTLLIKYAQEELWVYQALCNVIKEANEGSAGRHDTEIEAIEAMEIAYSAVEDQPGGAGSGRIEPVDGGASAAAAPGGMGGPPGAGGGASTRPDPRNRGKGQTGGRGFNFGGPGAAPEAAAPGNPDDIWKTYRYVNADGTPKTSAADVDADSGEFNLMPFRLLLRMDSRYIDHLLVAFRNSELPFEVQQVRINPEHATGGGGGGSRYTRPSGPPIGVGGPPGMMGPPTAGPAAGGGTSQSKDRIVTVEIRGVAYLIKPPNPEKLHIAAANPAAPSDAGAVPAPGAAANAPDAATATPAPATTPPAPAADGAAAAPQPSNETPPPVGNPSPPQSPNP